MYSAGFPSFRLGQHMEYCCGGMEGKGNKEMLHRVLLLIFGSSNALTQRICTAGGRNASVHRNFACLTVNLRGHIKSLLCPFEL